MTRLVILALLALACRPGTDEMAQTLTLTPKGLFTQGNDLGSVPDGAMSQADDVAISRDGMIEPRRGMVSKSSKALTRLFPWKSQILGWGTAGTLSSSLDSGATWSDYAGSFPAPAGGVIRSAEANGNLYFTTSGAPQRLDSLAGTPEQQGIPDGLDCQASVSGAGTAVPTNSQTAYRVLFGKRDANGNTIYGGPSGQGIVYNSAGSTQDVSLSYTVPQGLPSSSFFQVYRSASTGDITSAPDDELGLVYEGVTPQPIALTQLSRTVTTVTGTTASDHGYAAGEIIRLSSTVANGTGNVIAVGSGAATSTDAGQTWTARTMPAGTYYAVAFNGAVHAAVGPGSVAATSPDGITWTSRTIPAGDYYGIVWNGSIFVAVGLNVCATSSDGTTWAARTIPAATYWAIAWNGSILAAVSTTSAAATSPDGITWAARTMPAGVWEAIAWGGATFAAVGANVAATSPDGVIWTSRTIPAGTYYAVAWNGSVFAAIGGSLGPVAATSPDGITWTARTVPNDRSLAIGVRGATFIGAGVDKSITSPDGTTWTEYATLPIIVYALSVGASTRFLAGERTLLTASGNTFTYNDGGGPGTVATSATVTPLTGIITDSAPAAFRGATIYTAPSQNGITGAASRVLAAADVATYRGSLFYANITYPSTLDLYLLAVAGTSGVNTGDTITIDGLAYTAGASENIGTRTFQFYTSGTVAQNIYNTSQSLIHIINRTQGNTVTARDVSVPTGLPGHLFVQENNASTTLTVAVSGHATAWSIVGVKPPQQRKNELRWSQPQQPDVVPLLNESPIGSADKAILRTVATRSSLFIFKEDGVWSLTGDSAPWSIAPFDPTCILKAPDTAVMLDNSVVAFTNQGAVRVTDTGVTVLSRPIETGILPLLSPANAATTSAVAFGVAYESARKYYLWLPALSSDTQATQAYVYDLFTKTWVRDTRAVSHAIVSPADDRMYLVDGAHAWQERKGFAVSDYADGANPIACAWTFAPHFGSTPGKKHHFTFINAMYRSQGAASAVFSFWTDIMPTPQPVTIDFTAYGSLPLGVTSVRTLAPIEASRGSQLFVKMSESVNGATFQFQGLGIMYRETSEEAGQ